MVVVEVVVVVVVVEVVDGVVNTGVVVDSWVDLIARVVVVTITGKNQFIPRKIFQYIYNTK